MRAKNLHRIAAQTIELCHNRGSARGRRELLTEVSSRDRRQGKRPKGRNLEFRAHNPRKYGCTHKYTPDPKGTSTSSSTPFCPAEEQSAITDSDLGIHCQVARRVASQQKAWGWRCTSSTSSSSVVETQKAKGYGRPLPSSSFCTESSVAIVTGRADTGLYLFSRVLFHSRLFRAPPSNSSVGDLSIPCDLLN